jgi:hypothetical protein
MGEWWLPSQATESIGNKVGSGMNNLNEKTNLLYCVQQLLKC